MFPGNFNAQIVWEPTHSSFLGWMHLSVLPAKLKQENILIVVVWRGECLLMSGTGRGKPRPGCYGVTLMSLTLWEPEERTLRQEYLKGIFHLEDNFVLPSGGLDSQHRSFQACLLPTLLAGEVFCRIFCLTLFYDQPISICSSFEQI